MGRLASVVFKKRFPDKKSETYEVRCVGRPCCFEGIRRSQDALALYH
jgi:hypothetical protein